MVLLDNLPGILSLVAHHPRLVRLATANLSGRLNHRFSRNGNVRLAAPSEQLTVMVTDLCNLRCKMCHYAHNTDVSYRLNRDGRMEPGLFYKLIDETPQTRLVSFTGGEPLLHPLLPDFIAYAKKKGRFCSVTTNGWFLAERAQELCRAGLDVLAVSVDGNQAVHDQIRGRHSFERLEFGLERILSSHQRPLVFTTMAISNLNFNHLMYVYQQAIEWKVQGHNFNHLWIHSGEASRGFQINEREIELDEVQWSIHPEQVDVEYLVYQFEAIRSRNRGRKFIIIETPTLNLQQIKDWYQNPAQFVKWSTTRCAWIRMKVWPDGSFKPCRGWTVGNMAQQNTMQLWNAPLIQGFRQKLARQGAFPICARCCYIAHR